MYLQKIKRLYTLDGKGRPEHLYFVTSETEKEYFVNHVDNWCVPKDTMVFNGNKYLEPTDELDLLYMGKLFREFKKTKEEFTQAYLDMRDVDNRYLTIDWETLSEDFNIFIEDINDFYETYILPKVGKE